MKWGRLATANYRGAQVPRVLGIALAGVAIASTLAVAAGGSVARAGWGALGGSLLVAGACLIDDLAPIGPRGLRNHLRSLAEGHMTTGVLKLMVIVGAAVVVVALQPVRPGWVRLAGVVLVAGSANLWNGLDVVPGRALKTFLVVGGASAVWLDRSLVPTVPGLVLAALPAVVVDLREVAMLGDAGANLLGFTAGLALFAVLPDPWVLVAAVAAIILNALADTVTLSRLIGAAPPLRWLDELGRTAPVD
jgi:hypothetical protein